MVADVGPDLVDKSFHGSISLAAMRDADDEYDEVIVVDLVKDSVVTNAQAPNGLRFAPGGLG